MITRAFLIYKYNIVVTNPPYMNKFSPKLKDFINKKEKTCGFFAITEKKHPITDLFFLNTFAKTIPNKMPFLRFMKIVSILKMLFLQVNM